MTMWNYLWRMLPLLLLGVSLQSPAALIDPDGPGGDAPIEVSLLDWLPGNLRVNCTSGCSSPSVIAAGDTLQSYAHGELGSFDDAATTAMTSLGTAFEWTFVAGFQEIVTLAFPGIASFANILGGDNFFEIYYDPGLNASQLVGGETMNDGTLILSGRVLPFNPITGIGTSGFFAAPAAPVPLDQFGANDYLGLSSVVGVGGAQLSVDVTFAHPDFFLDGPLPRLFLDFTSNQGLPFTTENPSSCFVTGAGAVIDGAGGGYGSCTGSAIGSINSDPGEASPASIFLTDASSSIRVPVPGSLALLTLGLLLMGRRKPWRWA